MSLKEKRSSILKKQQLPSYNRDTSSTATTSSAHKNSKKIEFNRKKSIKEFLVGEDTDTIWGHSYEVSTDGTPLIGLSDATFGKSIPQHSAVDQNKENCIQNNTSQTEATLRPSPNSTSTSWDLSITIADDEKRRIRCDTSATFSQSLNTTDRLFVEPFIAPAPKGKLHRKQDNLAVATSEVQVMDISPMKRTVSTSPMKSPRKMIYYYPKQEMFVEINDVPKATPCRVVPGVSPEHSTLQRENVERIIFQTPTKLSMQSRASEAISQPTIGGTSLNISETSTSHPLATMNQRKSLQSNFADLTNMSSDVDTTLAITDTVAKLLKSGSNVIIPLPTSMELDESTTDVCLPTNALSRARPSFLPEMGPVNESQDVSQTTLVVQESLTKEEGNSLANNMEIPNVVDISSPLESPLQRKSMSLKNLSIFKDLKQSPAVEESLQRPNISKHSANKSTSSNRHGLSIDIAISSLSLKLPTDSPEAKKGTQPKILRPTLPLRMFDSQNEKNEPLKIEVPKSGQPQRSTMVAKTPNGRRQTINLDEDMEETFKNDYDVNFESEVSISEVYFDQKREIDSLHSVAQSKFEVDMEESMKQTKSCRATVCNEERIAEENTPPSSNSVQRNRLTVISEAKMELTHVQLQSKLPTLIAKSDGINFSRNIYDTEPMMDTSMEMEQTSGVTCRKQSPDNVRATIHESCAVDETIPIHHQLLSNATDCMQQTRKTFHPEETIQEDTVALQHAAAATAHPARKTILCNDSMVIDLCTKSHYRMKKSEPTIPCSAYCKNIDELSIHATSGAEMIDMKRARPSTFNDEHCDETILVDNRHSENIASVSAVETSDQPHQNKPVPDAENLSTHVQCIKKNNPRFVHANGFDEKEKVKASQVHSSSCIPVISKTEKGPISTRRTVYNSIPMEETPHRKSSIANVKIGHAGPSDTASVADDIIQAKKKYNSRQTRKPRQTILIPQDIEVEEEEVSLHPLTEMQEDEQFYALAMLPRETTEDCVLRSAPTMAANNLRNVDPPAGLSNIFREPLFDGPEVSNMTITMQLSQSVGGATINESEHEDEVNSVHSVALPEFEIAMEESMKQTKSCRATVCNEERIAEENTPPSSNTVQRNRLTVISEAKMELTHVQLQSKLPTLIAKSDGINFSRNIYDTEPMMDTSMEMEQTSGVTCRKQSPDNVRATIHKSCPVDETIPIHHQLLSKATDCMQQTRKTFHPEETIQEDTVALQHAAAATAHPARKTILCNDSMVIDLCAKSHYRMKKSEPTIPCSAYCKNIDELSIHATSGAEMIDMKRARPSTFNDEHCDETILVDNRHSENIASVSAVETSDQPHQNKPVPDAGNLSTHVQCIKKNNPRFVHANGFDEKEKVKASQVHSSSCIPVISKTEKGPISTRRTVYNSIPMEETPHRKSSIANVKIGHAGPSDTASVADDIIQAKKKYNSRQTRKPRQTILIPQDIEVEEEEVSLHPLTEVQEDEQFHALAMLPRETTEDCVLRSAPTMAANNLRNVDPPAGLSNIFREPLFNGPEVSKMTITMQLSQSVGGKTINETGHERVSSRFIPPSSTVHELSDISMCNSTMRPEAPQVGNITGMMSMCEISETLPPTTLHEGDDSVSVICRVDEKLEPSAKELYNKKANRVKQPVAFASIEAPNVGEATSDDEFYDADENGVDEGLLQVDPLSLTKSRHLTMKFVDVEQLEQTVAHRAAIVVPSTTHKRAHAHVLSSPVVRLVPEVDPLHLTAQNQLPTEVIQQLSKGPMQKRPRTSSSTKDVAVHEVTMGGIRQRFEMIEPTPFNFITDVDAAADPLSKECQSVGVDEIKNDAFVPEKCATITRAGSQTIIHDPSVFAIDEDDLLDDESDLPCSSFTDEILPVSNDCPIEEETPRNSFQGMPETPENSIKLLPGDKMKEVSFYRDFANLTIDSLDSWDVENAYAVAVTGKTSCEFVGRQSADDCDPTIECISLSDDDSATVTPPKKMLKGPSSSSVLDSTIASDFMRELRQKHPQTKHACCKAQTECLCRTKRELERRKDACDLVWGQFCTWFDTIKQRTPQPEKMNLDVDDSQEPRLVTFEERIEELNWRLLRTKLEQSSFSMEGLRSSTSKRRSGSPSNGQFPETPSVAFLCENLRSYLSEQKFIDTSTPTGATLPATPRITLLISNKLSSDSGTLWQLDCSEEQEGVVVLRHRTLRSVVISVQLQQSQSKGTRASLEENRRIERIQVRECQQEYIHSPKLLLAHIEFMRLAKETTERTLRSTYRTVASLVGLWKHFDELLRRVFDCENRLLTIIRNNDALLCYDTEMERFFVKKYFHQCGDDGKIEPNLLTVHFNWIRSICATGVSLKRPIEQSLLPVPGDDPHTIGKGVACKDDQRGLMFLECLLWNVAKQFES